MSFKRLQEQAYDHLKNMVLADEFDRDAIYSETKIAETLGISRTPIRDALQRLSHDGLIDIMPSKGFCVHKLTYADIIEIYQMRCAVEGYCAKLLAERRHSPEAQKTLDDLTGFVAEQRTLYAEDRPVRDLVELDYKFHTGIVAFSRNRIFLQTYSNQMHRMRMITFEGQGRPDRRKSSLAEHAELVEAIARGDADTAKECIMHHYQNMLDSARMADLMREKPLLASSGAAAPFGRPPGA